MAWRGIKRIQMLLSELVGTYFIVLTYGLSMVEEQSDGKRVFEGPVSVGFAVLAQTYAFSHVSLAQFNPAVTLGLWLTRSINLLDAAMCITTQVLAGLMAGATVSCIANEVVAPHPTSNTFTANIDAAVVELIFTFAVVLVALNSLRDMPNSYFGIAVGLTVLGGMYAAVPYSGGAFNPALALGLQAACSTNGHSTCDMSSLLIYWLASLAAGVIAAGAYMLMNKSTLNATQVTGANGTLVEGQTFEEPAPAAVSVLLVELLGTFLLTITSALSQSGLATGCILTAMVYMGNRVSGGEYNPAVSFGVALRSRAPLSSYARVLLKVVGALIGGFVVYGLSNDVTYPNPDGSHGAFNALVFETLFSIAWVLVVLCVATPTADLDVEDGIDNKAPQSFYGLAIGMTVAGAVYCAGKHTGASGGVFNPAVGTGLCVTDALTGGSSGPHLWIYWAGPILASLLSALLFSLTHSRQERFGYRPV